MNDVVYLVGPGPHEDLRYSLRSLRNVEHGTVWIVGHKPAWVRNVEHVPPGKHYESKWRRLREELLRACRVEGIPKQFAYWNDDHFALRPTDYPLWHRGPIEPQAPRRNRVKTGNHLETVAQTAWLLRRWGIERPLNYEVHVPQVLDKDLLIEAGKQGDRAGIDGIQLRTLYSNWLGLGGEQVRDVKIGTLGDSPAEGQQWVSTSDRSFERGRVGKHLRSLFPDPSPFEEA